MPRIAATFALSIGMRAVNAGLLFGIGVALANWLGPEGFGIYTLVLAAASVIGIPLNAGLPTLLARETAKLSRTGEIAVWKGLLNFAMRLVLAISTLGAGAFFIYYFLIAESVHEKPGYLFFVLLLVPVIGLDRLRGSVMQGLGSSLLSQVPETVVRPLTLLFAICIGSLSYSGDPLEFALGAYVVTAILAFAYGSYLLGRAVDVTLWIVRAEYRPKTWVLSLFSLGALSASQTLVGNADVLLLGWLGAVDGVGVYKVALQGVALMLIAQNGIGAVLTAKFSEGFASNDLKKIVRISDSSVLVFSVIGVVSFGTFVGFGETFVQLFFGERYQGATTVLIVLGAGQLVNAFTGPSMTLLVMSGNERSALYGVVAGGLTMVAIALVFVPRFGGLGMAASSASGVVISNLLLAFAVRIKLKFDPTALGALIRASDRKG